MRRNGAVQARVRVLFEAAATKRGRLGHGVPVRIGGEARRSLLSRGSPSSRCDSLSVSHGEGNGCKRSGVDSSMIERPRLPSGGPCC